MHPASGMGVRWGASSFRDGNQVGCIPGCSLLLPLKARLLLLAEEWTSECTVSVNSVGLLSDSNPIEDCSGSCDHMSTVLRGKIARGILTVNLKFTFLEWGIHL